MFKLIRKLFFDKSFIIFLIIGIVNTLVGLAITFVCYNLLNLSYWTSTALDYFLASILSYFLNKHYTFGYKGNSWKSILRFTINIIVCYFIAFSLARPFTRWILHNIGLSLSVSYIENISMLIGTGFFMIINYLGQRFYTFRK